MRRRTFRTMNFIELEDRLAPATFVVLNLADNGPDSFRDCVGNVAGEADLRGGLEPPRLQLVDRRLCSFQELIRGELTHTRRARTNDERVTRAF